MSIPPHSLTPPIHLMPACHCQERNSIALPKLSCKLSCKLGCIFWVSQSYIFATQLHFQFFTTQLQSRRRNRIDLLIIESKLIPPGNNQCKCNLKIDICNSFQLISTFVLKFSIKQQPLLHEKLNINNKLRTWKHQMLTISLQNMKFVFLWCIYFTINFVHSG